MDYLRRPRMIYVEGKKDPAGKRDRKKRNTSTYKNYMNDSRKGSGDGGIVFRSTISI